MSHGPFCRCCGCQLWIIREADGKPAVYCRACKKALMQAKAIKEMAQ